MNANEMFMKETYLHYDFGKKKKYKVYKHVT